MLCVIGYQVQRKIDDKIYALKRVKISSMNKKDVDSTFNEIRLLASIRHKHVVGFLEAFIDNEELCIIMEYCGCGDLNQKIERYKRRRSYIDENVIWRYLIQALKAMTCLHSHNICHRDLKCANVFIAEDGSIKIGDLNVSKVMNHGKMMQTQIGTPYYM
jgi:NIMA (never in mitosis gene a)-related kinase